jgi:hypothetical protein
MSDRELLPPGFVRFEIGRAEVVCADYLADATRLALEGQTLHRYAETAPGARALAGRGVAYAATLPGDVERVVVRHNHHGGLFAAMTGDWFIYPGRAPHELATSERLRRSGVATPTMLGYVIYRGAAALCRIDVMSREVPDSFDLSAALVDDTSLRRIDAWRAARRLLDSLAAIGARHHDLNAKNILMRHAVAGEGYDAMVLDVDRVKFAPVGTDVSQANASRLVRSLRKWQRERGAAISDAELAQAADILGAA